MQYRHIGTIGGQFKSTLCGIAADARGQLYAAGDSEIKMFDAGGRLRKRWTASQPVLSVAVAGDGAVYAGQMRQIEIFQGEGGPVRVWHSEKLRGRVTALGFSGDSVLAGDAMDRAIQRFDRDGKFLNTIGKDNPVNGLLIPNGVVDFGVDPHGVIFAANPGKHRVECYSAGGELLGHIGRFDGNDPAGFTGCCNPTNVAVGSAIYTTEKAGPRVKAYDFEGKLLAVIAADVFDANCKNMDIAVDGRGRVYVADTVKLAVFVFEPVKV
jgi:sugar lactone lactonase YvrE